MTVHDSWSNKVLYFQLSLEKDITFMQQIVNLLLQYIGVNILSSTCLLLSWVVSIIGETHELLSTISIPMIGFVLISEQNTRMIKSSMLLAFFNKVVGPYKANSLSRTNNYVKKCIEYCKKLGAACSRHIPISYAHQIFGVLVKSKANQKLVKSQRLLSTFMIHMVETISYKRWCILQIVAVTRI